MRRQIKYKHVSNIIQIILHVVYKETLIRHIFNKDI